MSSPFFSCFSFSSFAFSRRARSNLEGRGLISGDGDLEIKEGFDSTTNDLLVVDNELCFGSGNGFVVLMLADELTYEWEFTTGFRST